MKSTDIVLTLVLGLPGQARHTVRGLAAGLGDPLSVFHPAIWTGCLQELGEDMGNNYNYKIHAGLQKKKHFTACFLHGDPGNLTSRLCWRVGRGRGGRWLMALEELLLAGLSSTGLLKASSKHEGRKPERNPLPVALGVPWGLGWWPPAASTAWPLLAAHPSVGVMRGSPRQFAKLN